MNEEHKEKIRQAVLKQYQNGFNPKKVCVRGYHKSPKAGDVAYRSSFEKKAYLKLDEDLTVKNYKIEAVTVSYLHPETQSNAIYIIDVQIEYQDGKLKLVEIKPLKQTTTPINQAKFAAATKYAEENGMIFEIWTEKDLYESEKEMRAFADQIDCPVDLKLRKRKRVEKSQRYYNKYVKNDKITTFCEFCQCEHAVLRKSYETNIARNNRYICEREGGKIAGSRPKPHLIKENPYAAEGKKQCLGSCRLESHQGIKPFEDFGLDKSRRDGYASQCKECRNTKRNEKYNKNKKET